MRNCNCNTSRRWRGKSASPKEDQPASPLNTFSEAIKFLGGITALLTLAGFLVVQAHLQLYTTLSPGNIEPTVYLTSGAVYLLLMAFLVMPLIRLFQYIYEKTLTVLSQEGTSIFKSVFAPSADQNHEIEKTAFTFGISPLLVISIIFLIMTFFTRGPGLLLLMGGLFVSCLLIFIIYLSFNSITQKEIPLWKILFNNLSVFLSTIILVSATSVIYGVTIYDEIILGGGKPRIIVLIGKQDSKNLGRTGISMQDDAISVPVCQIVEMTDALLIFDPPTNSTVVIKESEIIGKKEVAAAINCRRSY